ncbi:MAG TPA: hypothetical protein VHA10_22465 [Hypericibacter adhaerens]|jgi:hypothetical protein|uniref:Uncharacterized protein n=1 Tax=Hypericibacter adhaerens TaxID=2602016 RepID=A0A5J6MZ55_9PROT|nr:hypothetical protein [Hypericibacter adhaerens]QEX22364.1 hypothetical protein FRZ61_22940 [Hypericibacter adhaerens]HWA45996.1 hypothetical protein [Hypericibacter adhaerens]
MGALSIWHWVIVLLLLIPAWPAWQIAKRAGLSGAWGLLMIFPVANLIAVWLFAFLSWPVDRHSEIRAN